MTDIPLILQEGERSDPAHQELYTKLNNYIRNVRRKESIPAAKAEARSWHEGKYKVRFRRISSTYNCFGLVFANRRTSIDPELWDLIRNDDGYRLIPEGQVQIGDIAIYKNRHQDIAHVGIIVGVQVAEPRFTVLSKWGPDGEYVHELKTVPDQFGRNIEFWTDREL